MAARRQFRKGKAEQGAYIGINGYHQHRHQHKDLGKDNYDPENLERNTLGSAPGLFQRDQ